MRWPAAIRETNWRLLLAAVLTAAILHICATFAAPYLAGPTAYARLTPALPPNRLVVLPAITPERQPIPFLAPDVRYAMCRFETKGAPVEIKVHLPDAGWTVSLTSPSGDTIYAAAGSAGRATDVTLLIVQSDEAFLGVTPEARGVMQTTDARLLIAAERGIALIRAPDQGFAYRARVKSELELSSCGPANL